MSNGKRIVGIVLIALSIFTLISWEKWGKAKFLYDEVAVFREDVAKGTLISQDMFEIVRWPNKDEDALKEKDIKGIVGKVSSQNIRKETPIYKEYFIENQLLPSGGDDKYIFSIPSSWIEGCPESIGRSDRVYFYAVGQFITNAMVLSGKNENGDFNIIATNEQIAALSKIAQGGTRLVISCDRGE